MKIEVKAGGKVPMEVVATRGFTALPDAERQKAVNTWLKVLDCPHIWQEPDDDGERRCALCRQKRVPSIEQTPGLVVVPLSGDRKVWVKRDEYPACSCAACRMNQQAAGDTVAAHSGNCPCDCEKGAIDLWTFLLPEEY